jgi:competence protein ComEA
MGGDNRQTVVAVVVGFGLLVGGLSGMATKPAQVTDTTASFRSAKQIAQIVVHVAGWVVSPGVVHLSEGAHVADAISAAGGLRLGALSDRVNLAAPVHDGDQVLVPGPGASPITSGESGPLALNHATVSDLEELPGVGPVLAGRIVEFRNEHGPFDRIEDLLEVSGIGESKLASLRDLLRAP